MQAKKLQIASLIITYNRVREAKAQMDIIRELWEPLFEKIDIYHEFNGKKDWYPEKYKEDHLHRHKSMLHFIGASHMLNQGVKRILNSGKKYDFIIVTSADTWFYDSKKLKNVILTCLRNHHQLATSLWAGMLLGTEFFIITPELAKKVFPLRFTWIINKYINKYRLFKLAHSKIGKIGLLESVFTIRVMKVLKNPNKIYLIPGRRVVSFNNRFWSPNFYASHHDPRQRRRDILPKIRHNLGVRIENMPSLNKFLA